MIDLAIAKKYLRIDHDLEDDIIGVMLDAAEDTLRESGVDKEAADEQRYNLAVYMLTAFIYENRGDSSVGFGISPGMQIMIEQLRNTQRE